MVHMLEIVRQVGKVDFPQVIVSNFRPLTYFLHISFPRPPASPLLMFLYVFFWYSTWGARYIKMLWLKLVHVHSSQLQFFLLFEWDSTHKKTARKNPRLLLILFISISLSTFKLLHFPVSCFVTFLTISLFHLWSCFSVLWLLENFK